MRVVLTGAGGFIGREIARELRLQGHVVAGWARRPVPCAGVDDFVADLLRPETYGEPLRAFRPDALVHAGWFGVAPRERDLQTQLDNIAATGDIVAQAVDAGARVVVGLGTQAEYGLTTEMVDEQAPTRPVTLYGISKLAAGAALLRIARQKNVRGVWARIFGVYGPRETAPSMLPWCAREFAAGRRPQLTSGTQGWDFLHVRDVAGAVAGLLACEGASGVFNVASGVAAPLRETVLRLRDIMQSPLDPDFGAVPFGPEQIMFLGGDPSNLIETTGWRPRVSLDDGLREVADEALHAARLA